MYVFINRQAPVVGDGSLHRIRVAVAALLEIACSPSVFRARAVRLYGCG